MLSAVLSSHLKQSRCLDERMDLVLQEGVSVMQEVAPSLLLLCRVVVSRGPVLLSAMQSHVKT